MGKLLLALGVILILGGLGHVAGIIHLYLAQSVPEMNRVLLDAWVAEAQIVAGAFTSPLLVFILFRVARSARMDPRPHPDRRGASV